MRLLLDTHAYLWWLNDDPRLRQTARDAIADPTATVHVSAASIWEIAIKAQLRRIELHSADLAVEIAASGFVELPIRAHHAQQAGSLRRYHDDPFDRMLVAQAAVERLTLVTHDRRLRPYGVELIET